MVIRSTFKFHTRLILSLGLFLLGSSVAAAQELQGPENPPIPIEVEVRTARSLDFGAFTVGSTGGKVWIDHSGVPGSYGDVYLLDIGSTRTPALFDLTAIPGSLIRIQVPGAITLNGPDNGSLQLEINSFGLDGRTIYPTFISTKTPPATNEISVGGVLHVGGGSPRGEYSGIFRLTFIHE